MEYVGPNSGRLSMMSGGGGGGGYSSEVMSGGGGGGYSSEVMSGGGGGGGYPKNILTIGDRKFEVTIVYRDEAGRIAYSQGIDETSTKVQNLAKKLFQEANIADNQNYVVINGEGVHIPETEIVGLYTEEDHGPLETLSPDDHPILDTWTAFYDEVTRERSIAEDISFEERRNEFPTFQAFAESYNNMEIARPSDATPEWALYNIKHGNRKGIVDDAARILADLCNEEDLAAAADRIIREGEVKLGWVATSDNKLLEAMRQIKEDQSNGYPYTPEQLACLEAVTDRNFL